MTTQRDNCAPANGRPLCSRARGIIPSSGPFRRGLLNSNSGLIKPTLLSVAAAVLTFTQAGCTVARYSELRVQVVDEQTKAGIPKAQVRTLYVKPMMDMTYQRKDRKKTGADGLATLTVATNWSQRMILGWTHGIMPRLSVQADGFRPRQVGIPYDAFSRAQPLLIQMERTK